MGVCDISRAHTLLYRVKHQRRTRDSHHVPLTLRDQAQAESSGTFLRLLIFYNNVDCLQVD